MGPFQMPTYDPGFSRASNLIDEDLKLLKSLPNSDFRTSFEKALLSLKDQLAKGSMDAITATNVLHTFIFHYQVLTDLVNKSKERIAALDKRGWGNEENRLVMQTALQKLNAQQSAFEKSAIDFVNDPTEERLKQMDKIVESAKTQYKNIQILVRYAELIEVKGASSAQALIQAIGMIERLKATVDQYVTDKREKKAVLDQLDWFIRTLKQEKEQLIDFRSSAFLKGFNYLPDGTLFITEDAQSLFQWFDLVKNRTDAVMDSCYVLSWKPLMEQFFDNPKWQKDPQYVENLVRIMQKAAEGTEYSVKTLRDFKVAKLDEDGNIVYDRNGFPVMERLSFSEEALNELEREKKKLIVCFTALKMGLGEYDAILHGKKKTINLFGFSASVPVTITRAENEQGLSDLEVLRQRFNLAVTQEKYFTEDSGTVFGDQYQPYMDKLAKRTWWDKHSLDVCDWTATIMMFIPLGVTQIAGGVYTAARYSAETAFQYSQTGQFNWQTAAMAATGLAIGGGAVIKFTRLAKTSVGAGFALGFAGLGMTSGTYLMVKGSGNLYDELSKGVRLGWTEERAFNVVSNGVMLAVGALGMAKGILAVRKALVPPKPEAKVEPKAPTKVVIFPLLGLDISAVLPFLRTLRPDEIATKLSKALDLDTTIGTDSFKGKVTAAEALAYLDQIARDTSRDSATRLAASKALSDLATGEAADPIKVRAKQLYDGLVADGIVLKPARTGVQEARNEALKAKAALPVEGSPEALVKPEVQTKVVEILDPLLAKMKDAYNKWNKKAKKPGTPESSIRDVLENLRDALQEYRDKAARGELTNADLQRLKAALGIKEGATLVVPKDFIKALENLLTQDSPNQKSQLILSDAHQKLTAPTTEPVSEVKPLSDTDVAMWADRVANPRGKKLGGASRNLVARIANLKDGEKPLPIEHKLQILDYLLNNGYIKPEMLVTGSWITRIFTNRSEAARNVIGATIAEARSVVPEIAVQTLIKVLRNGVMDSGSMRRVTSLYDAIMNGGFSTEVQSRLLDFFYNKQPLRAGIIDLALQLTELRSDIVNAGLKKAEKWLDKDISELNSILAKADLGTYRWGDLIGKWAGRPWTSTPLGDKQLPKVGVVEWGGRVMMGMALVSGLIKLGAVLFSTDDSAKEDAAATSRALGTTTPKPVQRQTNFDIFVGSAKKTKLWEPDMEAILKSRLKPDCSEDEFNNAYHDLLRERGKYPKPK